MPGSRRSTPRRARSSSVASNVSTASTKQENTTPRKKTAASAKREASVSGRATPTATPKKETKKKEKDTIAAAVSDVETTPGSKATTTTDQQPKKESSLRAAQAKAVAARPPLPERRNPVLPDADVPVKVQVIRRDGQNIIIGRVKLPTVNGTDHSFLLKRYVRALVIYLS